MPLAPAGSPSSPAGGHLTGVLAACKACTPSLPVQSESMIKIIFRLKNVMRLSTKTIRYEFKTRIPDDGIRDLRNS